MSKGYLIQGPLVDNNYPLGRYRSIIYIEDGKLFYRTTDDVFQLSNESGDIELSNYYTKTEIDTKIANIVIDGAIDEDILNSMLTDYVTIGDLEAKLEELSNNEYDINDYAKLIDLDSKVDKITGMGLSTHNFSDVYKNILDNINIDANENVLEIIKLNGINQVIVDKAIDLSLYTNDDIDEQMGFKADKTELDGLATETYVDDAIGNIIIPDVDLTAYSNTVEMNSAISTAIAQAQLDGGDVDLSAYETITSNDTKLALKADKTEVEAVDAKVDALVIPSITGLATETYVDDAIGNIVIPDVDLSTYETIISNDTKLALKADKTELDGLATEDYVTDAIANIEVVVDMDDYYNKSEIDNSLSTKAYVLHTHSANEISETLNRTFIDAPKKAQIDSNTTDIASLSQRIGNIESSSIITTDEKVKLNASTDAKYLEDFIDTNTLLSNNGKIQAISLSGLVASIHEVNQLTGITGNIQSQIDALNNIGNFTTSVDTYAELLNIVDMTTNDMVIVISDESRDNGTTIYIYNVDWKYAGVFKGGELRDFVQNPLRLETEVTGVLPKNNYEKQTASETSISNTNGNFTANNVEDALNELFTYANNIKSSVASAIGSPLTSSDTLTEIINKIGQIKLDLANSITNKGVITYPYNTLSEMANKVRLIPNITMEGDLKSTGSFQVTTVPYIKTVLLNTPISEKDVTSTLIEYVYGATNVQHYIDNMDDDRNYSMPNQDIEFNGSLKVKTDYQQKTSMVSENDDFTMYSTIVTMKTIKIKF